MPFTLKLQVVGLGNQRTHQASHGCGCLVNNLTEIRGKPRGEGLWEADSPKCSAFSLFWLERTVETLEISESM